MSLLLRICGIVALAHALVLSASAQTPIPGKYYEYYTVARTGTAFTDLGSGGGPSINDGREVAFRGTTANGNGLWFGTGSAAAVNFNPGESFSSSDIIQPSVQINANHQVVSEDRITTTSPATTSIRLYNAGATDSFLYSSRGGPFHTGVGGYLYDAVFANPATNKNGDVVFTAQYSSQFPFKVLGYVAAGSTTPVERPIRSGNPKPMIADNGNVVIQVGGAGGQSNYQILVYPAGLGTPVVIADTATNWVSLDNDPGISRDGRVIAFQGNPNALGASAIGTTAGPGIFVAVDEGTGFASGKILRLTGGKIEDVAADRAAARGNFDGICDTGEICKPAAELGFDASGNPITIASYGVDSRVGVVNVDLGAPGVDDDTFVVSFIATPGSASRDNPALPPGTPLLFSAQQGLWTIRVDVQHELAGSLRVYHPFTPIPVIQIGDRLGPDTVTGIGVYDPIANAAHDESGNIRTMRRGDHRVAFWASTNNGQVIVRGNHLDSDQDGLLDHWETTGIDMDQDGIVDLRLSDYGASPFTRDVFLQVDWVGKPGFDLFKPAGAVFSSDVAGAYSLFEANFRNAEVLTGPLYGARIDGSPPANITPGVVPHVDAGSGLDDLSLPLSINLGGGTPRGGNYVGMPGNAGVLPQVVYFGQPGESVAGVNVRGFQDIKDTYFGTGDKNARLLAFHYSVFAPFQDFIPNYPKTPYSAVITGGNSSSIEVNQPLSAFPARANGMFLLITSGSAITSVRQIESVATNGVTGNAVFNFQSDFNPSPSLGDSVAFLDGSTGLAEVAFAPAPDNNSLPGNDFIVSTGSMGVLEGVPPNQCMEAETASHELGHTLGLRHGGDDQTSNKPGSIYKSVMSYTWQLNCTPVPRMPNYSMNGDNTFDDYAHLQFNFSDVQFHLSTSLGEARGEGYPSDLQQQAPEQTLLDAIAKNGPLDTVPPTVVITSPASGAGIPLGGTLTVNITATDNVQISRVSASFDTDGNGALSAAESVNATRTGTNTYQAVFSSISGTPGPRPITAVAWDGWSNSNRTAITINVGTISQVTVPNLAGQTQAAASTAIANAGLVLGTVTYQSSSIVAAGSVIGESPAAGTSVNRGSAVNIVVSSGSGSATIAIAASHVGNFTRGQTGALLSIVVSNSGAGSTSGTVTVSDTLPAGLTLTGVSGAGWNCTSAPLACSRSDSLAGSASYPAIVVTANVAANAAAQVTNLASVSIGSSAAVSSSDVAVIGGAAPSTAGGGGTGASKTFTFTFTDPAGFTNIQHIDVLINSALDGRQACYLAFVPASATGGTLLLVDDAGDAAGPYSTLALPGSGTVQNGQCTIAGSGSIVSGSGNNLTLTLPITFSAAFAGNKVVYLAALDTAGVSSPWQPLTTWNVPGQTVTGPSVTGMSPAQSSTLSQTYTFTFTDTNGWQDIQVTDVLLNSAIDGRGACYLAFVPSATTGGSIYLVDDTGDAGGPYAGMALPGTGTVQNSQCGINGAGSSVTASGNTLTLTLAMTFSQSFAGNRVFYLSTGSKAGPNSGWQSVGAVTVP